MLKILRMKFTLPAMVEDMLALFAGAALPLAFPPFSQAIIAILSPALLLTIWLNSSTKRALIRGWLFGLGFYSVGIYWVYISLHVYGNASPFVGTFATILLVMVFALYPAVQGYLFNRLFPQNNLSKCVLVFPASWVLFEWIRSWFLFAGFPWLLLGDSQLETALRGYAPVFGVWGVSLFVVLTSGILVGAFLHPIFQTKGNPLKEGVAARFSRRGELSILLIISTIVFWLIGHFLAPIHWTQPIGNKVKISLIQGNIPQDLKWQTTAVNDILKTYLQLNQQHLDSDIIVWPEAAIVVPDVDAKDYLTYLDRTGKTHHTAIIAGIPIYKNQKYYNGLLSLGDGNGTYLKHHLLPFGDYIPFRIIFDIFSKYVQIPMSDFGHGPVHQAPLIAKNIPIAPFICYEIVFPAQVIASLPQAQLLLLITDDTWFGDSIALEQHLATGQMRALETGRPLLFDSNSGITAIINAAGKIQKQAPKFTKYVLTDTVQPMQGSTPFVVWGVYPILLIIALMLCMAWRRK